MVPELVVTPPLDLYGKSRVLPDGNIEIRVTTVSKKGSFKQNGGRKVVTKETLDSYRKSADAVFRMIPNQTKLSGSSSDADFSQGTAFHIGENLVLTNLHVLDPSKENTTSCRGFQVINHEGDTFECKSVHYCNKEHDLCLIEMDSIIKRGKADCFLCSGPKYEVSLSSGPSLKLNSIYKPLPESWDTEITTAIGNSNGFGIHYSQGLGVLINKSRHSLYFWAPITSGNSGGPLLDQDGKVIGVIKQQSIPISDDRNQAFNVAVPIELAISLIRDALRDNPETLLKFNNSVVE